MAMSLNQLTRANQPKAPRILIHGVAGVGKTTFAAEANAPVFVQTEDGLGTLAANHFPLARTFEEVIDALAALYTEPHDFKTVVIDSVDWLEPLVWAKACRDNGWGSIEDAGYGKGYVAALNLWRQYIDGLNALRDDRAMTVVQIAHTDIKRFDSPEHDPMTATSSNCIPGLRPCCRSTRTSCCLPTTASVRSRPTWVSTRRSTVPWARASASSIRPNAPPFLQRTATACQRPYR